MSDHTQTRRAERHLDAEGQCPAVIVRKKLASRLIRRPEAAVAMLIGLLLAGLALPESPFVSAGGDPGVGTPVASPVSIEPPADRYWVTYEPCTAVPREFDATMQVVAGAFLGPEPPSISLGFQPEVRNEPDGPVTSYQLPDGPVPPASSVDAVVQLLGANLNCNSTLQSLAYWSEGYLIRTAIDDELGGTLIAALWRSAHPEETTASSYSTPIADGNGSEIQAPLPPEVPPAPDRTGIRASQMYGFRMIDDTHLGAYVEIADNVSASDFEPIQPTFEQTGYAVFELQPDGTWLIDAYESPFTILRQRLFPEGSATPAA